MITLADAAGTTCVSSNSHDELLSVHEINPTSLAHQISQIFADFFVADTFLNLRKSAKSVDILP